MAWKILGCVSIGAERFGITLLHELSCATVPALFLCCAFVIRRTGGPVAALAFLAIMLPGYAVLSYPWSFLVTFGHPGFHLPLIDTLERDTPYIIGFGILLLTLNGKATWPYFIVGLFIPLCLFWSIDRGAFFAALSLVGCALHVAYAPGGIQSPRSWFPGMWILLGSLTGLGVIFLVFGPNEIRASIDITGNWFGVKEFFDGRIYLHPWDFTADTWLRYTAPLVMDALLLFCAVHWRHFLFSQKNKAIGVIYVLFISSAIFWYRYALGKTDLWHIHIGSFFTYLSAGVLLWVFAMRTATIRYRLETRLAVAAMMAIVPPCGLDALGPLCSGIRTH